MYLVFKFIVCFTNGGVPYPLFLKQKKCEADKQTDRQNNQSLPIRNSCIGWDTCAYILFGSKIGVPDWIDIASKELGLEY